MVNVYNEDNIKVDYCSNYEYVEIFGLSDEEFEKLINDNDNHLKTFNI